VLSLDAFLWLQRSLEVSVQYAVQRSQKSGLTMKECISSTAMIDSAAQRRLAIWSSARQRHNPNLTFKATFFFNSHLSFIEEGSRKANSRR
jgi:hypothetical protein